MTAESPNTRLLNGLRWRWQPRPLCTVPAGSSGGDFSFQTVATDSLLPSLCRIMSYGIRECESGIRRGRSVVAPRILSLETRMEGVVGLECSRHCRVSITINVSAASHSAGTPLMVKVRCQRTRARPHSGGATCAPGLQSKAIHEGDRLLREFRWHR